MVGFLDKISENKVVLGTLSAAALAILGYVAFSFNKEAETKKPKKGKKKLQTLSTSSSTSSTTAQSTSKTSPRKTEPVASTSPKKSPRKTVQKDALSPEEQDILSNQVLALGFKNQHREAINLLNQLIEKHPKNFDVRYARMKYVIYLIEEENAQNGASEASKVKEEYQKLLDEDTKVATENASDAKEELMLLSLLKIIEIDAKNTGKTLPADVEKQIEEELDQLVAKIDAVLGQAQYKNNDDLLMCRVSALSKLLSAITQTATKNLIKQQKVVQIINKLKKDCKTIIDSSKNKEHLAVCYFYMTSMAERKEDVVGSLNKALQIFPDYIEALQIRASLFIESQEFQKAEEDLQHIIRLDPKNAPSRLLLAKTLLESGKADIPEVISLLEGTLALVPGHFETAMELCQLNMRQGDVEKNVAVLQTLIDAAKSKLSLVEQLDLTVVIGEYLLSGMKFDDTVALCDAQIARIKDELLPKETDDAIKTKLNEEITQFEELKKFAVNVPHALEKFPELKEFVNSCKPPFFEKMEESKLKNLKFNPEVESASTIKFADFVNVITFIFVAASNRINFYTAVDKFIQVYESAPDYIQYACRNGYLLTVFLSDYKLRPGNSFMETPQFVSVLEDLYQQKGATDAYIEGISQFLDDITEQSRRQLMQQYYMQQMQQMQGGGFQFQ